ncbi:hypothetical protein EVG20_g8652 [Dentipellis fragilis]|uniref:Protein-S-isoprenylcysteine O-methyltransferase n=1 Tax=Dentipellis fragilis TaxID=205917 RepID=A0A4Y9Y3V2_9AGAM|nr:hypothetical protein EVG20_g8652 [Dentipellis fragilis]
MIAAAAAKEDPLCKPWKATWSKKHHPQLAQYNHKADRSWMPRLLKLGLLALGHASYHVTVTPPNAPPKGSEKARFGGDVLARKVVLKAIVPIEVISILGLLIPTLYQAATTLALLPPSDLIYSSSATQHFNSLPKPFLAGIVLQLLAGIIRLSCYRALGRLFTFELSIRTEHKLVTSGPYSIVRHPSYVGTFCAQTGMLLCTFGPGGWLYEAGWMSSGVMRTAAVMLGTWVVYLLTGMVRRTSSEDRMLKREFGKEWDMWARRVPYKMIPGVF